MRACTRCIPVYLIGCQITKKLPISFLYVAILNT